MGIEWYNYQRPKSGDRLVNAIKRANQLKCLWGLFSSPIYTYLGEDIWSEYTIDGSEETFHWN